MPLYLRLVELLKLEYRLIANFPKQYKYSLGNDMVTITWKMLDSFIETQLHHESKKGRKLAAVQTINQLHASLQLRARFCGEIKLTSLKQQAQFSESLAEIGKMIGAWLKHV